MTDEDRFWVGPESAPDTYQLVTCLGGGAEGEVWTAVLPLSAEGRRNVAVKILPPGTDGDDETNWINHGHLLRSIAHPGLVRVIEVFSGPSKHRTGQTTGTKARYVIMDLVEGVTLREWLDDNPGAGASQRLRALVTVAAALDEMHSGAQTAVPVAHGDVKPSNIILRPDGSTVLVDLGLTRLADGAGRVGRSRPYAAPELFQPGAGTTPEADRFAFAATVVHALLGEPAPVYPEHGPDLNQVVARLQANPLTARRPILVNKVMEVLAAPPAQRPANLRTWLSSLTDTLSQVTESGGSTGGFVRPADHTLTATGPFIPAPMPVAAGPIVPVKRSSRARLIVVAVVVLVLLIGGGTVYALTQGGGSKGTGANGQPTTTPVGQNQPTDQNTPPPSSAPSLAPSTEPSPVPSGEPSGPPGGGPSEISSPPPSVPPIDPTGPAEGIPLAGDNTFIADSSNVDTSAGNININGQTSINGFLTYGGCCNDTTLYQDSVDIDLGRSYKTFYARLGIEDKGAANVTIEFKIYADQRLIYDKKLRLGKSENIALPVSGVLRLELDFKGQLGRVQAAVGDPRVK